MAKQNNTKVVTGIVRLSYANIWDPKAPVSGGDPRYSCSLIIPKSDTGLIQPRLCSVSPPIQSKQAGKGVPWSLDNVC